jgi:hypothetical protein
MMMLRDWIAQVCAELDLPVPKLNERKSYLFRLRDGVEIEIRDLDPGCSFHAKIGPCPNKREEDLFMLLMRANYLGQSTGSTRIGMSGDEKFLTLSSAMPYELSYRNFRESLEDFVNFLLYWREEIEKFETQQQLM